MGDSTQGGDGKCKLKIEELGFDFLVFLSWQFAWWWFAFTFSIKWYQSWKFLVQYFKYGWKALSCPDRPFCPTECAADWRRRQVARKIQVTKTLVGKNIFWKRRKTLKNAKSYLKKKVGEIPRRRWLIREMEQAICPLLSSLPLLIAPGFQFHPLQRNLWWDFLLQEQIEQGVVLLDATGQTIDEILGKAANAKSKSIRIIKLFKMRCWQQKLGTTWTWSRGRESTTSSPREWSTRCGWTSSAKCQRPRNSKWVVWQAARVRIR